MISQKRKARYLTLLELLAVNIPNIKKEERELLLKIIKDTPLDNLKKNSNEQELNRLGEDNHISYETMIKMENFIKKIPSILAERDQFQDEVNILKQRLSFVGAVAHPAEYQSALKIKIADIRDIEFSVFAQRDLLNAGIETLGQLKSLTNLQIFRILGRKRSGVILMIEGLLARYWLFRNV
jgi:hypothetical protein